MTKEEFKKQIEFSLTYFIPNEDVAFWKNIHTITTIKRTLRLALQYPNLAQEYLDSLSKVIIN